MAGHSKWKNIQHRKSKQDANRGKIFTKLIREITIAARMGGADPGSNPRLRAAIDEALACNMSKDTIKRAIERGTGGGEGDNLEELTYEGYGVLGVAVIVECMTNNRNRTVSEVRHAFTKCGGNLGTDGSVAYLFSKKGLITFPSTTHEENLMEVALESGAHDITQTEDGFEVITQWEELGQVKDALIAQNLPPESVQIAMIPSTMVEVTDVDAATKILRLIDMLEDLDDVQKVHTNASIADDVLEKMEK